MKILSWNLQKRDIANWADKTFQPDVLLLQEYVDTDLNQIPLKNKVVGKSFDVGGKAAGTAIYSKYRIINLHIVKSPHADFRLKFWLGKVYKTTTVAELENGVTVVSFHGYNGWTPVGKRDPHKLIDHVEAVLRTIGVSKSCVFSGDFNSFTREHLTLIDDIMKKNNFKIIGSAPYNDVETLDLCYSRGFDKPSSVTYAMHESDHPYMLFEV